MPSSGSSRGAGRDLVRSGGHRRRCGPGGLVDGPPPPVAQGPSCCGSVAFPVRRTLAFILLAGALLRGLYLAEIVQAPDFAHPQVDADYHDYWARGLAFQQWTPSPGHDDPQIRTTAYFKPPGYPYFLALVYRLSGGDYLRPRLVQMLLGLWSVVLAFLLGRRVFDPATGLILAAFLATNWVVIYFEGELLEPALLAVFLLALVLCLGRWLDRRSLAAAVGGGLLLGMAAIVRPNALVLLPVVAGWMIFYTPREDRRRTLRRQLPVLLLGAALALAPVTARNAVVARDFVPISTNGGINLWIGNNPRATGLVYADTEVGLLRSCYDWPALVANLEQSQGRSLRHSEVSSYFCRRALAFILERPGRVLRLLEVKTLLFWGQAEPADNKDLAGEQSAYAVLRWNPWSFALILALAVPGLVLAAAGSQLHRERVRSRPLLILAVTCVLAWYLSFLPFAVAARFRAPVLSFLLLPGAWSLRCGLCWLRRGQMRRVLIWTAAAALVGGLAAINWTGYRPNPARWHYQRGVCYLLDHRTTPAMAELQSAWACNPRWPAVANDLGAIWASRGRAEEAATWFRRALALDPRDAAAHCNLAAALERQGRTQESGVEYLRAAALAPADQIARAGVQRMRPAATASFQATVKP